MKKKRRWRVVLMWAGVGVAAAFVVFLMVAQVLGSRLPEEHEASMRIRVGKPIGEVWALIADPVGMQTWSPGVTKVERLPDRDGRETIRQTMGRNSFVLETTAKDPPRAVTRAITDDNGPFTGSWSYRLEEDGPSATVVTLTERGRVKASIPRFVMHSMIGETTYIRRHLAALAQRLGQAARPEPVN